VTPSACTSIASSRCPGAVEDDRVPVDAADGQARLLLRDDDPAGVGAAVDEDRIAGRGGGDRGLDRRRVLRHADDAGRDREGDGDHGCEHAEPLQEAR
jgi:hypothetical protein